MAGPLRGIRVIDLTHEWAGPHAARLLADLGAEVIKIEYFRRLDHMRGARKDDRMFDRHARFQQLNRNKRSLPLDLNEARDRSIFEDLVRVSDVLICNSRPGVLERLGFGYDRLRLLKPDIILASLSACGQTGPDSGYAGYGGGLEATSGVQSLTAYAHDGEPRRVREMDVTNGIGAAAAVLTALEARRRTGAGTWFDLSELEFPGYSLAGESVMEFARNGSTILPVGNRHPERAPHGCYPCAGEDAWIAISVGSDAEWRALCAAIGHPDAAAADRFADRERRAQQHDEIDRLIADWTARRDKMDAMLVLQKAGVTAGAVLNAADLHRDPHLKARGYFRPPVAEPDNRPFSGMPFRMPDGGAVMRPSPLLGEGASDIICGLLGRPAADVRTLTLGDIGTDFDLPEPK
jgi:crotonobetainyl-CoA:carnitine CoA-transferase CaiB-like acyl-CoA transferase